MNERRQHRRLTIRLPVECASAEQSRTGLIRATTGNISTGGVYFEVELVDGLLPPEPKSLLNLDLTVPPGEGHFPYEGRIRSVAEVVRCDSLAGNGSGGSQQTQRLGVAARFKEPLKLDF